MLKFFAFLLSKNLLKHELTKHLYPESFVDENIVQYYAERNTDEEHNDEIKRK